MPLQDLESGHEFPPESLIITEEEWDVIRGRSASDDAGNDDFDDGEDEY